MNVAVNWFEKKSIIYFLNIIMQSGVIASFGMLVYSSSVRIRNMCSAVLIECIYVCFVHVNDNHKL